MSLYTATLYPNKPLIVLDGEQSPLFRLALNFRELTQHGHNSSVVISSVMGGSACKHKRERIDGETMRIAQMLIRCEASADHPQAVSLVFLEKPSSFTVLPEAAAKQAAGM